MQAYQQGDYFGAMARWLPLAQNGDPRAQTGIAVLYRDGLGLPPDRVRALAWLRLAMQSSFNDAEAMASELAREMTDSQRDMAADLARRLLVAPAGAAPKKGS